MHWIIQENLITNQKKYVEALHNLSIPYSLVTLTKEGLIHGMPDADNIWVYGSVGLVKAINKMNINAKIQYDEKLFSIKTMNDHYKDKSLSYDSQIIPIKNLNLPEKTFAFLRPNTSLKLFNGTIVNAEMIELFKKEVSEGKFSYTGDELVVLSKKKTLYEEYRLFIVNKEVVTGSLYMYAGKRVDKNKPPTLDVIKFGNDLAKTFSPADAYVLDVVETPYGLRAVEFNCINCAGPINADVPLLVSKIESFYMK